MTKEELMRMAREAGLPFKELEARYCDMVDLPHGSICRISDVGIDVIERLANALLERAAMNLEVQGHHLANQVPAGASAFGYSAHLTRALKINTGD